MLDTLIEDPMLYNALTELLENSLSYAFADDRELEHYVKIWQQKYPKFSVMIEALSMELPVV